jgi:hypothetical protein
MRTLLFTVDRLEFVGAGKFMIGGRNCADQLRRGDRLHVRDENNAESTPVFCVDEIIFYNRTVEVVDPGHSAGLFFPNALAPHVRLGDQLRGESDS